MELPSTGTPTRWLTQDHLAALKALLPYIEDRRIKRRVKECVLGLSEQLSTELSRDAVAIAVDEPLNPLTERELELVQVLLAKGVQHNGLVPVLSTIEVGRALQILGELLARAKLAALDFEDQDGLEWVFDVASDYDQGVNRENVRRLENLVRSGLGLKYRLSFMPPFNSEPV